MARQRELAQGLFVNRSMWVLVLEVRIRPVVRLVTRSFVVEQLVRSVFR